MIITAEAWYLREKYLRIERENLLNYFQYYTEMVIGIAPITLLFRKEFYNFFVESEYTVSGNLVITY